MTFPYTSSLTCCLLTGCSRTLSLNSFKVAVVEKEPHNPFTSARVSPFAQLESRVTSSLPLCKTCSPVGNCLWRTVTDPCRFTASSELVRSYPWRPTLQQQPANRFSTPIVTPNQHAAA